MSYVNAWHDRNADVIKVVERNSNRQRQYKEYQVPYTFYVKDPKGKYRSIYQEPLTKIVCKNNKEFRKELAIYNNKKVYETDLNPIFTVLSENYQGQDPPPLNIGFIDIETDFQPFEYPSGHRVKVKQLNKEITVRELAQLPNRDQFQVFDHIDKRWVNSNESRYLKPGPGYASAQDAFMPITAISLYLQWLDALICLALVPSSLTLEQAEELIKEFPNTILFTSESKMLDTFLDLIEDTDILSAWNGEGFDIPYLVNRISIVLSKDDTRRLCLFNQLPKRREYERYGKTAITYDLIGRMHIDSLELYRKYTYEERHSYRLDAIAEYELGERKTVYEGTLDQLYHNDFKRFIEYNRQDCNLLNSLERKLKFIDLASAIAHENGVLIQTTMGAVAVSDQAIINEAHRLEVRVPNRSHQKDGETNAAGAYVAYPKKGLHDWVGSLDVNSLYPSVIRALNMGPETIVGQIRQTITQQYINEKIANGSSFANAWEGLFGSLEYTSIMNKEIGTELIIDWENGTSDQLSAAEIYRLIFETNKSWMLSANGTIFSYEREGVIPGLLKKWYAERKEMQKTLSDWKDLQYGIVISDDLIVELKNIFEIEY